MRPMAGFHHINMFQRSIVVGLLILTSLSGCKDKASDLEERQRMFFEEQGKLCKDYLAADADRARRVVEKMIQSIQSETVLARGGFRFESHYWLCYARLYALDSRTGNDEMAEL